MPTITLENGTKVEVSQESYDALAKAVRKPTFDDIAGYRFGDKVLPRVLQMKSAQYRLLQAAFYLNEGWRPDWGSKNNRAYKIIWVERQQLMRIDADSHYNNGCVYFASSELAEEAIEILGVETVKTALGVYLYDSI